MQTEPLIFQKRGRPRKNVNTEIMVGMIKNAVPITAIARHFGIHRDTLYANFPDLIQEAYASYRQSERERQEAAFEKWIEKKRLKEAEKKPRRRYRRGYNYR